MAANVTVDGVNRSDVLIVGAGPIGIELAVGLKREGIPYEQVDAGQIGSTISWYAPQTQFFSSPERIAIAGVPLQTLDQSKATREEYLTYLRSVVLQFDLKIETGVRVNAIARSADGFVVTTFARDGERKRQAKNVVLAIGDMHRPHLLGVPGEDLPHVSHFFGDPHAYFRRQVLVVGGRNSAVEAAIRCVRVAAIVTLSYRAAELDPKHVKPWLLPEINAMIRDRRMTFLPGTTVREITPAYVVLDPGGRRVDADSVLLLTGYEQDSSLFESAGVTLVGPQRRPRFNEATMETDVPGLYVAGTAAAGTQVSGTTAFIETSHIHIGRIVAALKGEPAPVEQQAYSVPEQ
ncbi:MAG TPA: NAD(P)-binding domain-containing protein [Thermoanaerobaculia bacterium]|nr:NAD(P)-binding domain-containing protein [Thermoanaerobaculia bacterium]